jgi:hypothetical protein
VEMADQPYHMVLESVYHALNDCPLGRRIPPELRQPGVGGRPLCPACEARLEGPRRARL